MLYCTWSCRTPLAAVCRRGCDDTVETIVNRGYVLRQNRKAIKSYRRRNNCNTICEFTRGIHCSDLVIVDHYQYDYRYRMCAHVSCGIYFPSFCFFLLFFFFFLFIITLIRREMELRNAECIRLSGREGEIRSTAVGLSVTLVGAMCGSRVEFNNVNLASERWAFVWDWTNWKSPTTRD